VRKVSVIFVDAAVHGDDVTLNMHHVLTTRVNYQAFSLQHAGNSRLHYLSMIYNSFVPHPITTGLPVHTQWFTHDGAKQASQTCFWTSYDSTDVKELATQHFRH
jgi:hypothetical protein